MTNQNARKHFKLILVCTALILIVVYAYFQAHDILFGIKIKNLNLVDGARMDNNVIEIMGNAKNAVKLTLNGREISINDQGDFKETIVLLSGYNVIGIKAKDKFGYEDEKNFRLIGGSAKKAEQL